MNTYIYVLSVNGLLFLMSIIFNLFPPKKINNFYGYRTPRTIQNQDIWEFANSVFNKTLLSYSAIGFLASMLLTYLYQDFMDSWFPMAFLFFTLLVCIVKTENLLNQYFDKEEIENLKGSDQGKRKISSWSRNS